MKQKQNAGFSLVEVLVAIVLLGALLVPTCSGLVLSARLNAKTDDLMQAQLAVSSAVETLMAEGIDPKLVEDTFGTYDVVSDGNGGTIDYFPGVVIEITENHGTYYEVKVSDDEGNVTVVTNIRKMIPAETTAPTTGEEGTT